MRAVIALVMTKVGFDFMWKFRLSNAFTAWIDRSDRSDRSDRLERPDRSDRSDQII